jgi:hypothetical protein
MSTPEFLICLECETPCYVFEWQDGKLVEILCEVCGNEDPEQFLTSEDFDQLIGA